jgi:hypothetical protein
MQRDRMIAFSSPEASGEGPSFLQNDWQTELIRRRCGNAEQRERIADKGPWHRRYHAKSGPDRASRTPYLA